MVNHSVNLHQVSQRLLAHITTLSTYPVFDPKRIREEVDATIKKVNAIVSSKKLTKQDQEIIKEINNYAQVLYDILSQRVSVQKSSMMSLKASAEAQNYPADSTRQDNIESDGQKSKNRRLNKEQLEILEGWFQRNKKHPYSQKEQTDLLMKSTNLSKSQVQNWISNRRRKEKNAKVSPELAQLLS